MLSGISLAINRPGGGVPLWGQASLDFDFTTMLALPAGTTFARASTATYADSTGTLKTAAVDEARFTFEPYRLIPRGYLTEPARTNVLLNSANLTQSGWTASSAGTTGEVAGSPTGNAEASRVLEDTENAVHSVSQSVSSS